MSVQNEVVTLEFTRDQALVVEQACELLARLRIGQFNRITEMMLKPNADTDLRDYCFRRDRANDALALASRLIYGETSYGAPDCQKDELYQRAWNIFSVLRYTRSWHDNPNGGFSVCYDKPMSFIDERLPKCGITKEDATV